MFLLAGKNGKLSGCVAVQRSTATLEAEGFQRSREKVGKPKAFSAPGRKLGSQSREKRKPKAFSVPVRGALYSKK